jgi:hypothetical protein
MTFIIKEGFLMNLFIPEAAYLSKLIISINIYI